MVKSIIIRCLVLSFVVLGGAVYAKGVKVVTQSQRPGSKIPDTMTMVFDQNNLHMESVDGESRIIMVFNGATGTMTIADMKRKTKMVITEEKLQKMRGGMEQAMKMRDEMMNSPEMKEAMKQMQERMKDMSEDERKVAAKYMPNFDKMGDMMDENDTKPPFRPAGTESVDSWKCRKYVRESEGNREEVWATDFSELGLSESDFTVFNKIGKLFQNLDPKMGTRIVPILGFSSEEAEVKRGYPGVPVKSSEYINGKLENSSRLLSAGYTATTGDTFKVPENLTEDDPFEKMEGAMPKMKQ